MANNLSPLGPSPSFLPSPCLPKAAFISLQTVVGGILLAVGLYLAQIFGLGTIGMACLGGGGGAALLLSDMAVAFAYRNKGDEKKTKSVNLPVSTLLSSRPKVFEGSITIYDPRATGKLGADLTHLFDDTEKLKRDDGKAWDHSPKMELIQCYFLLNSSDGASLPADYVMYFPAEFFYHGEDLKQAGEYVEFIYEDCRYRLQIAVNHRWGTSWDEAFNDCLEFSSERDSALPKLFTPEDLAAIDENIICCPEVDKARADNLRCQFNELFSHYEDLPELLFPQKPQVFQRWDGWHVQIAFVEEVKAFFSKDNEWFAVYCKVKPATGKRVMSKEGIIDGYSAAWPAEYVWIDKIHENLNREMVQKGVDNYEAGLLVIPSKNIFS